MTRISKQNRKRAVSPRRRKAPGVKTGSKQDNLPAGYKPHENAHEGDFTVFISKIK